MAEEVVQSQDVLRLRHSIRGCINSLKLGVSAVDIGLSPKETVEFLEYIEQAAEKMTGLIDQYDEVFAAVGEQV